LPAFFANHWGSKTILTATPEPVSPFAAMQAVLTGKRIDRWKLILNDTLEIE